MITNDYRTNEYPTHDLMQGNRNKIVNGWYSVGDVGPEGYSITRYNMDAQGQKGPPIGTINFLSPFRAMYHFGAMKIEFWAVPTKAGHSKIMANFPLGVSVLWVSVGCWYQWVSVYQV